MKVGEAVDAAMGNVCGSVFPGSIRAGGVEGVGDCCEARRFQLCW